MEKKTVKAIVLAAGQGRRMGTDVPKQYLFLGGHEVLYYSLKAFEESQADEVILVTGKNEISWCREHIVEKYGFSKVRKIIAGGKERYDSVYAGLLAAAPCDYVLIHDGARPFITDEIIKSVLQGAVDYGSCTTGMPVKDTIKVADGEDMAEDTPDRKSLWAIHTPQGFSYPVILKAHEKFRKRKIPFSVTDDTMLADFFSDTRTKLINGSYENIKVTTPEDMEVAGAFLKRKEGQKSKNRQSRRHPDGISHRWRKQMSQMGERLKKDRIRSVKRFFQNRKREPKGRFYNRNTE